MRIEALGPSCVIIKQGGEGCLVSAAGRRVLVPAQKVAKVVDATAAGDSFNAGFLSALLAGQDPVKAAERGHHCAAIVVQYRGAIVPREDFRKAIAG